MSKETSTIRKDFDNFQCAKCGYTSNEISNRVYCNNCEPLQITNTTRKKLLYCGYCNDALEFLSEENMYSCCNTACDKLTIVYYQKDVRN